MFVKVNKPLPNGKSFKFYDNLIFLNENNNNFQCFDSSQKDSKKWELQLTDPHFSISDFFEGILVVTDGGTTTYFINYNNGLIIRRLNFGVSKVFHNYFLAKEMVDGKYHNALVSIYSGQFLWHTMPIQFFEVIDEKYLMGFPVRGEYGKNRAIIGRYIIESGILLWRYDVTEIARWRQFPSEPEQPGEVRKFLGVWQDELLVALTNHTIIALDIHTGELKRKWRDVPEEKCQNIPFKGYRAVAIPYPEGMVLDSEGGKLVGADGIFYWEIDLHTGALLFKEFSAEFGTPLNEVQYSFARGRTPALSGDHLFLIGERYHSARNGNDSEVIAFNRKTQTIDWRHTFPMEEGVRFRLHLHSPVLEGNRLYVLDTSDTLHIFESIR
jgi:hypothetical protein